MNVGGSARCFKESLRISSKGQKDMRPAWLAMQSIERSDRCDGRDTLSRRHRRRPKTHQLKTRRTPLRGAAESVRRHGATLRGASNTFGCGNIGSSVMPACTPAHARAGRQRLQRQPTLDVRRGTHRPERHELANATKPAPARAACCAVVSRLVLPGVSRSGDSGYGSIVTTVRHEAA